MTQVFLRHPLAIAVLTASSALLSNAHAAPAMWNGAGAANDWADGNNWDGAVAPDADPANLLEAQISNGDTIYLQTAINAAVGAQHLYIGRDGLDGHVHSAGSAINADRITLGQNATAAGDINASLVVENADINAASGIKIANDLVSGGHTTVNFSLLNGSLNTSSIQSLDVDLQSNTTSSVTSIFTFEKATINSSSSAENQFGGMVDTLDNASNVSATYNTTISFIDTQWKNLDTMDFEVACDIRVSDGTQNSRIDALTQLIVDDSILELEWLELAEYTSADYGQDNTVTNNIDASFVDSTITIKRAFRAGDASAEMHASNTVLSSVNISMLRTDLNVGNTIELTDIYVTDGAYAEDKVNFTIADSNISVGNYLDIASDVYLSDNAISTAIVEAKMSLANSRLEVGRKIEIADGNDVLVNPASSVTGELVANSSVITAEQLTMGAVDGVATLQLENSYMALTDVMDPLDAADANSLEMDEAQLNLGSNSNLRFNIDGDVRADALNAKGGSGLYSAIDAIQVKLAGNLHLDFKQGWGNKASLDLIRAVRDDSLVLGSGAFTGIQGNFDKVTVSGISADATLSYGIVQDRIDGVDYDIYRVEAHDPHAPWFIFNNLTYSAGSLSLFSLGLLLLVGMRRKLA